LIRNALRKENKAVVLLAATKKRGELVFGEIATVKETLLKAQVNGRAYSPSA
jgi:hypothetical protein